MSFRRRALEAAEDARGALLLGLVVTGVSLAAFYVPSVREAWSSVVYLEASVPGGRVLRAVHHHGSHALVVVVGLELALAVAAGAYTLAERRSFWLRIVRAALVVATAVAGHLLPWDQPGYWARRVELTLTAQVPGIGPGLARVLAGGAELGQLGLSRWFALHAFALPAALAATVAWEGRGRSAGRHSLWVATAAVSAIALAVAALYPAPLGLPADATRAPDARPEWFLMPLYGLRGLFRGPTAEVVGTGFGLLLAGGAFAVLPLVDPAARRWRWALAGAVTLGATAAAFGIVPARRDARDGRLQQERSDDARRASRARAVAALGVPPAGPLAVVRSDVLLRGEELFRERCASCHVLGALGDPREATAPRLDGWGTERWILGLLHDPDGEVYFGRTAFRGRMPSVDVPPPEPEPGAPPFRPMPEGDQRAVAAFLADQGREEGEPVGTAPREVVARGEAIVREQCTTCHLFGGQGDDSGQELAPELARYGSLGWTFAQIHDPATPATYREHARDPELEGAMPAFGGELSAADLALLARYTRAVARGLPLPVAAPAALPAAALGVAPAEAPVAPSGEKR